MKDKQRLTLTDLTPHFAFRIRIVLLADEHCCDMLKQSTTLSTDDDLGDKEPVSNILVLYYGGTIGMKKDKHGVLRPARGYLAGRLAGLPQFHDPSQPLLTTPLSRFGKRIHYEIKEYNPLLDSSNMGMEDWIKIGTDVEKYYYDYDAFIILHGTDTMAYTASALSFMFENLSKTIILTGSQVPLFVEPNDAVDNLLGALTIAGHFQIPEVCLYFNHRLMRGNRCLKVDASGFNAFQSPNYPSLVKSGAEMKVQWNHIREMPPSDKKFSVQKTMNPNVGVLKLFPGITQATIQNFLKPPLQGCVMETYGSGNAPDNREDFLAALKEATDRGVIIVNVTQCNKGMVQDISVYGTGAALQKIGIVNGADMTTEAALTKLSYLLAKDLTISEVKKQMKRNLRGELTEPTGPLKYSLTDQIFIRCVAKAIDDAIQQAPDVQEIRKALYPILFVSAAAKGDIAQLTSLMMSGVEVNIRTYDLRSALHLAAAEGQLATVKFLLEKGADVNATDRWGRTPLDDAISSKHQDVVELLLKSGANKSSFNSKTPIVLTNTNEEVTNSNTKHDKNALETPKNDVVENRKMENNF